MDEMLRKDIARALYGDAPELHPEEAMDQVNAVIEALGLEKRSWIDHKGAHHPYFAVTWQPAA